MSNDRLREAETSEWLNGLIGDGANAVWWIEFDPAVGSEVRKTRPGIVVSNNSANRNLSRVVVVPLTSNTERLYPGEARVSITGNESKAVADQIMTADKMRLKSKIGELSMADMLAVEHALRVHLAFSK